MLRRKITKVICIPSEAEVLKPIGLKFKASKIISKIRQQ